MLEVTVDLIVFCSLFFFCLRKVQLHCCKHHDEFFFSFENWIRSYKSTFVNISILYLKILVGEFTLGPKCTWITLRFLVRDEVISFP